MIGLMIAIALLFVRMLCDCLKPRWRLEAEILALRHQLNVLQQRAPPRLHLRWADRALFIWLYESLWAIAAGLNERGIPAARGGKWSAVQVSRLIAAGAQQRPFERASVAVG
jgi:hypothetical protein